MNYSQVSSRHKMTGGDGRELQMKNKTKQKTSIKIGDGICQEREALIRFLMLAINFLCRGVSTQHCRKHTDMGFTIWITC